MEAQNATQQPANAAEVPVAREADGKAGEGVEPVHAETLHNGGDHTASHTQIDTSSTIVESAASENKPAVPSKRQRSPEDAAVPAADDHAGLLGQAGDSKTSELPIQAAAAPRDVPFRTGSASPPQKRHNLSANSPIAAEALEPQPEHQTQAVEEAKETVQPAPNVAAVPPETGHQESEAMEEDKEKPQPVPEVVAAHDIRQLDGEAMEEDEQKTEPVPEIASTAHETIQHEGEAMEEDKKATQPAPVAEFQPYQSLQQTYDPAEAAQTVTWEGPEPDSQISDETDSAIGSYASTRSTSVADSAYDFRTLNGRRYHAQREGADYMLPNDEDEMDRLDMQHHLFMMTLDGKLHRAPLKDDIQSALDIGTGTGIWAIDFADQYPSCIVTGTDISPIQPNYVPVNCRFYVEDVESPQGWAENNLDYIHGRMLVVGLKNWAQIFQRAYDALKPGGWIELQDLNFPIRCDDESAPPESPLMAWSGHMLEGAARFGIDLSISNRFPTMLAEAGFVNINSETAAWPTSRWPKDKKMKEISTWVQQNFLEGIQGFSSAIFTRGLGWSVEQLEMHLMEVRENLKDRNRHIYLPISFFWAQKPPLPSQGD